LGPKWHQLAPKSFFRFLFFKQTKALLVKPLFFGGQRSIQLSYGCGRICYSDPAAGSQCKNFS